ncbi:hypothetical protein EVA_12848 [gut metagenome]|uniref:Uncharacterized protein n=1 Tax=gut metagenome TaxID=749906 RepID=J9CGB5_9ZZZZ
MVARAQSLATYDPEDLDVIQRLRKIPLAHKSPAS